MNTIRSHLRLHGPAFGPVMFWAVMINIAILQWAMWDLYIGTFRWYTFYLLFFLIDLVLSVFLSVLPHTYGQIGRGMLIAWLWVPVSLVLFVSGFAIADAIGPI